jgi:preprotein translocase subunit SecF
MDKRTTGLIATIASVVLCGCPGLFGLCLGGTSVLASFVPGAEIDVFGSNDPAAATTMGVVSLCLSVIFIAIPIVVWFVTLRKKPAEAEVVAPVSDEPIPPAS